MEVELQDDLVRPSLLYKLTPRAGSHHRVNSGEQFHRDPGNGR